MIEQPGSYDVICNCRTQKSFDHVGNRRFRLIIENHSLNYDNAKSKLDKGIIVMSIFKTIQDAGGNFIRKSKKNSQQWEILSAAQSREKIGHSLRDALLAQENDFTSRSAQRDIYSIIGGSRGKTLQKLQMRNTRRLSLINGSYVVIKDIANSTRPSCTNMSTNQLACIPERVQSLSATAYHSSDEDYQSIGSDNTSRITEAESSVFEPLEVHSNEHSCEEMSSLLSSWVLELQ